MSDDQLWVNYGLWRPVNKKEIQIVRPVMIDGTPRNVGDVVTVKEGDAFSMIANGKARLYPPPSTEEESPEVMANRRKRALNSGPYKVEITRPCHVKGHRCEAGEIVSVDEGDAMCLATFSGKIIGRPPEMEDIREKISRVVEEMLRGASL
ncbi:MAG: hypothetical protein ACYC37_03690 [Desulfobacteria bacterium]